MVFGLLSLFALLGIGSNLHRGIYLVGFSVIFGPTACVLGITAMRKARRSDCQRPRGAIAGIILGGLAAVIAIPLLLLYLVFPGQLSNYVNCLSQAQTSAARQVCATHFYHSVRTGLGG